MSIKINSQPIVHLLEIENSQNLSLQLFPFASVIVKGQPGLPFRGLMVQAYDPETGQTIGNFQQGRGLKVLEQCSAVTHMDRRGKRSATLLWDPPGQGGGRVGFRGTVVKRYSEYYEGIDAIPES